MRTFTDQQPAVAPPRGRMTSRAARWATRRAGAGRAITEIAAELGCSWRTAMAAVHRWGQALLDADASRIDGVTALGLDEILMFRRGPYRKAFTDALPEAVQVADPFHVVKLANSAVDEVPADLPDAQRNALCASFSHDMPHERLSPPARCPARLPFRTSV